MSTDATQPKPPTDFQVGVTRDCRNCGHTIAGIVPEPDKPDGDRHVACAECDTPNRVTRDEMVTDGDLWPPAGFDGGDGA